MAQRKSPPTKSSSRAGNKPGQRPTQKSGQSAQRPGQRPPTKGKPKSIVNQRQTPWGMISAAVAVVLFAAAIVIVVIATHKSSSSDSADKNTSNCTKMINSAGKVVAAGDKSLNASPYLNELQCAAQIKGVTFKQEPNRNHVTTVVKYDSSPPVGGNHNQYWANCTGVVYGTQLANENATHMLEHGAVWITYNPKTLPASQVSVLAKYVKGIDRMAMTPYAGLKSPISLQAWGYQLFLQKANDPRIARFIKVLKYNPETTPENASCSDPYFDPAMSTPGHPQNTPKT